MRWHFFDKHVLADRVLILWVMCIALASDRSNRSRSIDRTKIEPNPFINKSFCSQIHSKRKKCPKFSHFLKVFSWGNCFIKNTISYFGSNFCQLICWKLLLRNFVGGILPTAPKWKYLHDIFAPRNLRKVKEKSSTYVLLCCGRDSALLIFPHFTLWFWKIKTP